ncbi:DUF6642 family protein [Nocardioides mangrovicus]|nr:DUF6642 family protein [Nocardioides mangrovicus]
MALGSGIFCLEGQWDSDLRDRKSVRPILELLDSLRIAAFIHRDVATTDEFEYFVNKWVQKRYDDYRVLYLAMHGEDGSVYLGRDDVMLEDLQEMLRGKCGGKVIYFGTCLTLRGDAKRIQEFARVTGARAVVGYQREVDWLQAAAFEVLLLQRLSTGLRSDAIFNRLVKEHGLFAKSLGLVVGTKNQVHRVPLREPRSSAAH